MITCHSDIESTIQFNINDISIKIDCWFAWETPIIRGEVTWILDEEDESL